VTIRAGRGMRARFALALMAFIVPPLCAAAPPTHAELTKLCTNAEDQAHCGRLVEASRLPALKKFVTREGDELRIALVPAGLTVFRDAINIIGARTYAVWDYVEDVDSIVKQLDAAGWKDFRKKARELKSQSRTVESFKNRLVKETTREEKRFTKVLEQLQAK